MLEFSRNEESQFGHFARQCSTLWHCSMAVFGCTGGAVHGIWGQENNIHGDGGMALKELDLDSETADLVRAAFDKSWQFVKGDPELAHNDVEEMRALLSRHITRFARNGEKDLWRLANSAIGQLRRERSAA
jgi:hypothetical protein